MENIIQYLHNFISMINGYLYYPILIILLLGGGIYFTLRTGFIQSWLPQTFAVLKEGPNEKDGVSSFQALMVSTASRIGTGNIVGASAAICLGGYGAVFWMWIVALIGGASAFIESTLAQIYKRKDENGGSYGGPAYYIEAGLKNRPLACIFSLAIIACYAIGFNMLASYNIQSSYANYSFYDSTTTPIMIGLVLAGLTAIVIFGGAQRIIKVTEKAVPFMGVIYLIIAAIMIILNLSELPNIFVKIFEDAFNFKAIFSGLAGSSLIHGIKRGLYSNEAGIGSAPNAAAAADTSHPVKQGLVQMLSVFLDTIIICSATAFMSMSSGIEPSKALSGAPYIQESLATVFGSLGYYFITFSLTLFGITTLIGNLYYVDSNLNYIRKGFTNGKFKWIYKTVCVLLIFIGAIQEQAFVWEVADLLMGIMALINLPVILILSKQALACLKDYQRQIKIRKKPEFKISSIGLNPDHFDFWK